MKDGEEIASNVLEHFGVKGMRWGVRKAQQDANASEEHKSLATVQKKAKAGGGTKALSNKELMDAIQRMNLENQFQDLKKKRSRISKGLNLVKVITGTAKSGQDTFNTAKTIADTIRKASSG
jgi:hypothetical protein